MSNVFDFPDKDAPDDDQVFIDESGLKWFKYSAIYSHSSTNTEKTTDRLTMDFWALNDEDANQRILSMRCNLRLYGKVISEENL